MCWAFIFLKGIQNFSLHIQMYHLILFELQRNLENFISAEIVQAELTYKIKFLGCRF